MTENKNFIFYNDKMDILNMLSCLTFIIMFLYMYQIGWLILLGFLCINWKRIFYISEIWATENIFFLPQNFYQYLEIESYFLSSNYFWWKKSKYFFYVIVLYVQEVLTHFIFDKLLLNWSNHKYHRNRMKIKRGSKKKKKEKTVFW